MTSVLLENVNAVLPKETRSNISILVESGRIAAISSADASSNADETIDLQNSFLYPGFIDIHTHGAAGVDINQISGDSLRKLAHFFLSKGVTGWLPTLVPDSDAAYDSTISAIDEVMDEQDESAFARILGVHYEGVFANEKMCGALRPKYFKTFEKGNEIDDLPRLKQGIHFTTVAPEIENGIALVHEFVNSGWIVSIGHTNAGFPILSDAAAAGAKHFTHFLNAMTGIHHRNLGVSNWVLTNHQGTLDIIADGIHVDPTMVKLVVDIMTPEKVLLISDSIAPTGLGDGEFEVWGEKIVVEKGKTRNKAGTIAGSVTTMLDALNTMLSLGYSKTDAAKMVSANPAKLLSIYDTCGSIEVGKRADLVAIDEAGDVRMSMVGGKLARIGA